MLCRSRSRARDSRNKSVDSDDETRAGLAPRLILVLSGHARPHVRCSDRRGTIANNYKPRHCRISGAQSPQFHQKLSFRWIFSQGGRGRAGFEPGGCRHTLAQTCGLRTDRGSAEADRWGADFQATNYGRALANASAAKPIYRKTGDRVLEQFLERVHTVKATSKYLYCIETVVLFGSMLSDVERLGDVDVAIDLQPKVTEETSFQEWCMARRRVAAAEGRSFSTTFEWATWPKLEILLLLKARSRSLSLHEFQQLTGMANVSYYVLLGDPGRIGRLISGGRRVISRNSPR